MDSSMEGMHHTSANYNPPLALTIVSGIFLSLGAVCGLAIAGDIILRRGWRSMMAIMIIVYPINALYFPFTVFLYWKYGRPPLPQHKQTDDRTNRHGDKKCGSHDSREDKTHHCRDPHIPSVPAALHQQTTDLGVSDDYPANSQQHKERECCEKDAAQVVNTSVGPHHSSTEHLTTSNSNNASDHGNHETADYQFDPGNTNTGSEPTSAFATASADEAATVIAADVDKPHCHHHTTAPKRPMWATVLIGVAHCGAGCVLGDIVGEWLVYGTNTTLNNEMLWPALIIDYAFALLFGIAFQYFSIAPMTGQYGIMTVWRAAKADILSLTSFEVGAFAWMIIYQVGIFGYKLDMATWTYWWMMQMGMILGFATAAPMNWWLLKKNIKETCC